MAEISRDAAEDGFHEIHLSGKQLVFLFMATTVVSVVIFLLGVVVGRRVPPETLMGDATGAVLEGTMADLPGAPPEPGQPGSEPPVPVPEEPDQFSYHERLQQVAPPPEQIAEPSPAQARQAEPAPPAAESGWVAQIGAYSDRETADRMVETLKRSNFPAFVLPPTPGSPSAMFRVRVGPYKERREAEAIAGRLERELQFDPFVTR